LERHQDALLTDTTIPASNWCDGHSPASEAPPRHNRALGTEGIA
jgi:hypothetical protein